MKTTPILIKNLLWKEVTLLKDHRIQQALDNSESNILILASLPDKRLAEKIDTIDLQSEIAIRKKMDESIILLETWRAQVIAARIYKAENKIPDAANEIELAIADIETSVAKAEESCRADSNTNILKTKIKST